MHGGIYLMFPGEPRGCERGTAPKEKTACQVFIKVVMYSLSLYPQRNMVSESFTCPWINAETDAWSGGYYMHTHIAWFGVDDGGSSEPAQPREDFFPHGQCFAVFQEDLVGEQLAIRRWRGK